MTQIQKAFPDSKLFAHYGCAERTVLAGWCEYRQEYHILPQYSIVEIDQNTSEIIGTNLFNSLNGFVRYRMTDTVLEAEQEPCPDCGRPYIPRLVTLGGRSEDYLFSPENGWVPPAIVTYPLKDLEEIQETRLLQKEKNKIVIQYSVRPNIHDSICEAELEHIKAEMHRLLGKGMEFHFDQVDGFARDSSGKFKWIISELDQVQQDLAP